MCGLKCRVARSQQLDRKRPDAVKLAPTARARFSEARVISDLIERGHEVFLAIAQPGVLAIDDGGTMRRVLVRSACVLGDGKTSYAKAGEAAKDYTLALVRDGDITYQPDISNKEAT
jgi:hypothetical protein